MGSGTYGRFGATAGSILPNKYPKTEYEPPKKEAPTLKEEYEKKRTITDNADRMKSDYPLSPNGYFGDKGKNSRVIKTATPEQTSIDFYEKIGYGGKSEPLTNGHGTRTTLPDGTIIVHRMITSTPGSPAVDIKVIGSSRVKSQKIHFVKEGN